MNSQAEQLNKTILAEAPAIGTMLSQKATAMYFPHAGILGQSAAAKGKKYNATIGIATEDDRSPIRLSTLDEFIKLSPQEAFPYAPSPGNPKLRSLWQEKILEKNPSLGSIDSLSTPVVTQALTHGLSLAGLMFLDPGQTILVPDPYWDNYNLLFEESLGAKVESFPCFSAGGFNLEGLQETLSNKVGEKVVLLLNFPNNPTGYTPLASELDKAADILRSAAEQGTKLVVIVDDAYFGLVFEDGVATESIFAKLAQAHENLLAVKIDGATKEDYAWGFRVGFITYGVKGGSKDLYKAMNDKTAGFIRGIISNCSQLSQSLMLKAYSSSEYKQQKAEKFQLLKSRYDAIKKAIAEHPEYEESFSTLPYNSGYFMCVQPVDGVDAEAVRQLLLEKYNTGLIALQGLLRIAFSSASAADIPVIIKNVHLAIQEIKARA